MFDCNTVVFVAGTCGSYFLSRPFFLGTQVRMPPKSHFKFCILEYWGTYQPSGVTRRQRLILPVPD